jgi:hypothetical protein
MKRFKLSQKHPVKTQRLNAYFQKVILCPVPNLSSYDLFVLTGCVIKEQSKGNFGSQPVN